MFDNTIPIGKAAWTKELENMDIRNINYQLTFEPHYFVDDYEIDAAALNTFDGHAFVI